MSGDKIGLLLGQVEDYNPDDFSEARVYLRGIAGKGTYWEFKTDERFEYDITPQQAHLLSTLQKETEGKVLSRDERRILASCPKELIHTNRVGETYVTDRAVEALYDLTV